MSTKFVILLFSKTQGLYTEALKNLHPPPLPQEIPEVPREYSIVQKGEKKCREMKFIITNEIVIAEELFRNFH